MAKRILMVVLPGQRTDDTSLARSAAESARASGGFVRMLYVAPVPRPRLGRTDHVVASSEQEIERITAAAGAVLSRLAWELDGVAVEQVVRFGRTIREVTVEADVFDADLVALAAPREASLRRLLLSWRLGRALQARHIPLVMASTLPERGPDRFLGIADLRTHP